MSWPIFGEQASVTIHGMRLRSERRILASRHDEPCRSFRRLDLAPHRDRSHQRLPCHLPIRLAGDGGRRPECFLVADPRLVDAALELEVSLEPVPDHLEVQFPHPRDQGLPRLLALDRPERGVLPLHHLEGVGKFLPLEARLRLDRHRDHGLGEGDRLEHDWGRHVAERVAGDACPRPDHPHDVSGSGLRHLLAAVGLHVPELGDVLLFLLERVPGPAPRLERAGIDPHEREVAVLLGEDLEDETAEGLGGVGPAGDRRGRFLPRIEPLDRRHIGRARQVPGHRVEHRLDADAVKR